MTTNSNRRDLFSGPRGLPRTPFGEAMRALGRGWSSELIRVGDSARWLQARKDSLAMDHCCVALILRFSSAGLKIVVIARIVA